MINDMESGGQQVFAILDLGIILSEVNNLDLESKKQVINDKLVYLFDPV